MTNQRLPTELTSKQKSVLTGMLLSDATVVPARTPGSNSSVYLSQGEKNLHVLEAFVDTLQAFISQKPLKRIRQGPRLKGKQYTTEQMQKKCTVYDVRTRRAPCLTTFCSNFLDKDFKRTVPSISFLLQHLDWEAFAWLIMGDGSAHDLKRSQQMKLHVQNFSYEEQSRLCWALHKNLGLECWPAFHKKSADGKVQQFHIKISGRSLRTIRENALPFIIGDSQKRVPPLRPKGGLTPPSSQWKDWYAKHKVLYENDTDN